MKTEEILEQRNSTHGDFTDHAQITQRLKYAVKGSPNWESLDTVKKESIEMILHKLGRITCGNPDHQDHWADIQGYAKLVEDRL